MSRGWLKPGRTWLRSHPPSWLGDSRRGRARGSPKTQKYSNAATVPQRLLGWLSIGNCWSYWSLVNGRFTNVEMSVSGEVASIRPLFLCFIKKDHIHLSKLFVNQWCVYQGHFLKPAEAKWLSFVQPKSCSVCHNVLGTYEVAHSCDPAKVAVMPRNW